jgi:hypothetical protein
MKPFMLRTRRISSIVSGDSTFDQKLHDIGSSGPVVLEPDYAKRRVIGLTRRC